MLYKTVTASTSLNYPVVWWLDATEDAPMLKMKTDIDG